MYYAKAVVEHLRDPSQVRLRLVETDAAGEARGKVVWDGNRPRTQPLTEDEWMTMPGNDEWLYLAPWQAKALYDALAEHYGHTAGDFAQTRRDFEHERARVDKLTDAVIARPAVVVVPDDGRARPTIVDRHG